MRQKIVIRNCDLLSFDGKRPVFHEKQDIYIEDQLISGIFPSSLLPDSSYAIIDATGMLAVPGMINTHAHVPMVLFRNAGPDVNADDWFNQVIFPLEANLTPEDVYWGAMLGIAEMIESGITCVADHYFFMDSVASAIEQTGLRANLVWAVFGHEGYKKIDQTLEFVDRWQGKADGRITTWLGPHSPYLCDPSFLKRCALEAKKRQIGIHTHVSETSQQVQLSFDRYGKSPVKVLEETGILDNPSILGHCLYPTESDLDILLKHSVGIAQAPKTYLTLAMGLVDLAKYQERGIPIGLATDGAVSSASLDLFEQMRLTALTQKHNSHDATVMNLDTILDLAFQGGARVLSQPKLGNIKTGFLADIVLLKNNRASVFPSINPAANLVYNLGAADVDTVICNGKMVFREGFHLTLDKEQVIEEVQKRLPRLLNKQSGKKVAEYPSKLD